MSFILGLRPMLGRSAAGLLALLLTSAAQAQPSAVASRPDPLDPRASVPPLRHSASLASFRRLTDEPAVAWRDANDAVGRVGGWRAYAREAQRPASGEPAAGAAPPTAAPEPPTLSRPPTAPSGHHGHATP